MVFLLPTATLQTLPRLIIVPCLALGFGDTNKDRSSTRDQAYYYVKTFPGVKLTSTDRARPVAARQGTKDKDMFGIRSCFLTFSQRETTSGTALVGYFGT
jgi:hypothetical protein